MRLDVDYIAAKQAIDELTKILSDTPHGQREEIADEIIKMVKDFKDKRNNYGASFGVGY